MNARRLISARRLVLASLAWLCALAGLSAVSPVPARADLVHRFLGQISEVPAGPEVALPGRIKGPEGMTVDSGDLFVGENGVGEVGLGHPESRVDEWDALTLGFIAQFPQPPTPLAKVHEVAVEHEGSKRLAYVAESKEVVVYEESAPKQWAFLQSWTGAKTAGGTFSDGPEKEGLNELFVAADNSRNLTDWAKGDVVVADEGDNFVDVFPPGVKGVEETPLAQLEGTGPGKPFDNPSEVAIDEANGDIAVVAYEKEATYPKRFTVVDVFEPEDLTHSYKFLFTLSAPPGERFDVKGVAFDGGVGAGEGDIYVLTSSQVESPINFAETEGFAQTEEYAYQFSPTGTLLGELSGAETEAKSFRTFQSVAVDSGSYHVFIGSKNEKYKKPAEPLEGPYPSVVDVFGPSVVIPDVVSEAASSVKAESSRVNGTVNPDNAGEATCWFAWGTSEALGSRLPCAGVGESSEDPIKNGAAGEKVHATLEGLEPGTTYFYRLQAENTQGSNLGSASQTQSFTTKGPSRDSGSAEDITSESATFTATIDPRKSPTSYYFQYGLSEAYGSVAPFSSPGVGASLGSGEGAMEVDQHVADLLAGTVYHYRLVVDSEVEVSAGKVELLTFYGPDHTLVTQLGGGSMSLLDGRAWELVSPPDKHGALIPAFNGEFPPSLIQASAEGSAISYTASVPTEAEPQGAGYQVQVYSKRGAQGWFSRDMAGPHDSQTNAQDVLSDTEYKFFSENLSLALLEPLGEDDTLLSPRASEPTPYVRRESMCEAVATTAECYLPLLSGKPGFSNVPPGTRFGPEEKNISEAAAPDNVQVATATPDMSHIVVSSKVPLTETATNGTKELYEWTEGEPVGTPLQLVSVLPKSEGPKGEEGPAQEGGVGVGNNPDESIASGHPAISNDGTRIVWTNRETRNGSHLYLRDMVKHQTVRLDVEQPGAPGEGNNEPLFEFESGTGTKDENGAVTKVFFTDTRRLTAGSSRFGADLYECDIVEEAETLKCDLSDLTPESGGHVSEVQNLVLGGSEDGSYLYFVANGVLPGSGASTQGTCSEVDEAKRGLLNSCNLYVDHEGTISYIATLSQEDNFDWGAASSIFHELGLLAARVSPNGLYAAFMSDRPLTGYDNNDAVSGQPDEEVYEYEAQDKRLVCASCNPTDSRPVGEQYHENGAVAVLPGNYGGFYEAKWFAASLTPGEHLGQGSLHQPRELFNNGRLFFNSSDALVPQDINGQEDAYEFEPAGTGDCQAASETFVNASGGCTGLISSGLSSGESGFVEASEEGEDAFFLTAEKLVPTDYDAAYDIYDAHVCSSTASCPVYPATPLACETADACREAPAAQPESFGAPASATFNGAGNVAAGTSSPPVGKAKVKALTRAQKLARSLAACKARQHKRRRASCEREARVRYATAGKAHKSGVRPIAARGRGETGR